MTCSKISRVNFAPAYATPFLGGGVTVYVWGGPSPCAAGCQASVA